MGAKKVIKEGYGKLKKFLNDTGGLDRMPKDFQDAVRKKPKPKKKGA